MWWMGESHGSSSPRLQVGIPDAIELLTGGQLAFGQQATVTRSFDGIPFGISKSLG
jgi:hypothetical protein